MKKEWENKKLGEVCDVITKGTTPTTMNFTYVDEGINFFKIESIDINGNILPHKLAHVTTECHNVFKRSQLIENDILFSIAGALGRVSIVQKAFLPANTNQALAIIRLSDIKYTLPSYITYALRSQQVFSQIDKFKAGVAQLNLSLEQIKELQIPIPSIPEQQRIVAILNEAFNAIAMAKENAEKNLQNAREIFESYLQSVFTNPNSGWEEKKIGDVSKINYGYTEKASFEEIGPKFLRITDIQNNNVNWDTVPFCKIGKNELSKYQLSEDDIVFARTGATTGKSFLVKNPPLSVFASYLIRLRVKELQKLSPDFLLLFFQTKTYWDNIKTGLSGSAQGGFNASKLAELLIPIPPFTEQQRIVANLDALSAETKKFEAIYNKKLANLEELKKSILQKAFSGEL
jgi:type I restriction enzyme S subunit